jgi:hypothetical protein
MGRRLVSLLFVSSVFLVAPCALAGEVEHARQSFMSGERLFAAGDYRGAARAFEEAYAARPHPSALVNAAKARRLAGDLAQAANHYRRVRDLGSTEDAGEARAALAELAPALGYMTVHHGADVSAVELDGAPLAEREVFVEPGEHDLRALHRNTISIHRNVRVRPGERVTVMLEAPPEQSSSHRLPPVATLILAGATLVAAGFTVWSGIDTLDQRDAWDKGKPGPERDRLLDDGLSKQERTNVVFAVTIGLSAITAVAAIFTDWNGQRTTTR